MSGGKKKKECIPRCEFKKIFNINNINDHLAELSAVFKQDGIVCISLEGKLDQRKVVGDMVQQIFGYLPYSEEYLLKLRSPDGSVLNIRNPEHREAIITELLRSPMTSENVNEVNKAYPPHRQFGGPCVPASWFNKDANNMRQDEDIHRAAEELLEEEKLLCPINRCFFRPPGTGIPAFLHWDRDPRTIKSDDKQGKGKELQGKVCVTEGTFVCVLGSHTPEFLEKFCALYDPLYPGRKLGLPKYGLDPNKDPMCLFKAQRSFIVPACCLVLWSNKLLHGHAIVGRNEGMQIGFYHGYLHRISAQQRMEYKESYLNGTVPRLYPSGDKVWFYPRKFLNFTSHFESLAKRLSAEAKAELVTTRVTKAGKEVVDVRPWGWPKDHCFEPFPFTEKGKCIVGIAPWEGFREPDAPPSDNGGIAQAARHDKLASKIRVVHAANGGMAQARASKKRPLGDSESVHDGEVQMPARQDQLAPGSGIRVLDSGPATRK